MSTHVRTGQLDKAPVAKREDYLAQIEAINSTLRTYAVHGREAALKEARSVYASPIGEDNEMLRSFSEVLLWVGDAYEMSCELGPLKVKRKNLHLHKQNLSKPEMAAYEDLNEQLRLYVRKLTQVIGARGSAWDREELAGWLGDYCIFGIQYPETAVREEWVLAQLMPMAAAEVAVYDYFSQMETVEKLRWCTPEEESTGNQHLNVTFQSGKEFGVLVKPGGSHMRLRRDGVVEFGIPYRMIRGFEVSHESDVRELDLKFFNEIYGEVWTQEDKDS